MCSSDLPHGALVNVVGTLNVFDCVKERRERIPGLAYASSIAAYDRADDPGHPVPADAVGHPLTHYGVNKQANEGAARIYWLDDGVASVGLRPYIVYGPGRDFGVTADPTLAMKAAVLGKPFQIRWGGSTDLIYTEDVARALVKASRATLDRARVYNLHGSSVAIADVVRTIETAWPQAKGLVTHVEQALPFPAALDDTRYQRDLGPAPATALVDGVRRTLDEFARLQKAGRLDARELS